VGELRYHGEWGVEAQFLKNEELLIGRRIDLREQAVHGPGKNGRRPGYSYPCFSGERTVPKKSAIEATRKLMLGRYSVEFSDMTGNTVAVVTLPMSALRVPTPADRPAVRALSA
jgi:hypothetical protein